MLTTGFEITHQDANPMIAQAGYPIAADVRFPGRLGALAVQRLVVSPPDGRAEAEALGRIRSGPPGMTYPNKPPARSVGFAGAVRVRALNDSPPHAADATR